MASSRLRRSVITGCLVVVLLLADGVGRVFQQVQQHLLDFHFDAGYRGKIGLEFADDLDVAEVVFFLEIVIIRRQLQRLVKQLGEVRG